MPPVVRCHLCQPPTDRYTAADRAYLVAIDHALDHHRAELLADPDAAQAAFTVTTGRGPRPLSRPAAGSA